MCRRARRCCRPAGICDCGVRPGSSSWPAAAGAAYCRAAPGAHNVRPLVQLWLFSRSLWRATLWGVCGFQLRKQLKALQFIEGLVADNCLERFVACSIRGSSLYCSVPTSTWGTASRSSSWGSSWEQLTALQPLEKLLIGRPWEQVLACSLGSRACPGYS